MSGPVWLALALIAAYALAWAAPRMRCAARGRTGILASWSLPALVLLCPLLIPREKVGLRALSAVISGDLFFKMIDTLGHWRETGAQVVLRNHDRWLLPLPVFAAIPHPHARRLVRREDPWPQLRRHVGGAAGFAGAVGFLTACNRTELVRNSFAINHLVMLLCFVVAIESLSQAICGIERLAGFDTQPIIDHAYRSGTISESWRRYNNRVHDWLRRNVFEPSGGRRHPVRSLMLVFLVSGLFHELMFGLATSRWTGEQFAFFAVQGPGALVARCLRHWNLAGPFLARSFTIGFLVLTSILFFDGVSRIFPFIHAPSQPNPWEASVDRIPARPSPVSNRIE